MMVSSKPIPVAPGWLRACLLICAVGLLPLGVAYAQDFDAVGKRLRAAVGAGELTVGQAKAMMVALKKKAATNREAVGRRLRAAVGAGELSSEQARAMMAALERPHGKKARGEKAAGEAREYLMQLRRKLGAAVKAGKVGNEDAKAKFDAAAKAVRKRMAGARRRDAGVDAESGRGVDRAKAWLIEVKKKLGAAVEAGEISREAAAKRLEGAKRALEERMAAGRKAREHAGEHDGKRDARARYAGFERRLHAAIEAGKMSEEEAKKRLVEFRKRLGERERRGEEHRRERRERRDM